MTYFLDNSPVYAALRQSIYDRLVSRARAANAILRETKQKAQVSSSSMSEFSPAAQAVLDAFRTSHTGQDCLAAALRAAADQVLPLHLPPELAVDANGPTVEWHIWNAEQQARFALLSIANELSASEVTS